MRTKRLLAAVAAASVAAIAPLSTTIASAAEPAGVGTGKVSSTLLQVDVGDKGSMLSVRVAGDDGSSTIDPANGKPSSSTSLTPLSISSAAVPALNVSSPSVSTSSTGAEDKKSVSPTLPSLPAFSGTATANLSSVVDTVGARSGLNATVANLKVAGGLLSVPKATVTLGTSAASTDASGTRTVSIPSIEVLNLGAVLDAVGLPLSSLPLADLMKLLNSLKGTLTGIVDPVATVATVNASLDTLQGKTGPLTTALCASVDGVLGTIGGLPGVSTIGQAADQIVTTINTSTGGTLPITVLSAQALPSCSSVTGTVQDLVNTLQAVIGDVVTSLLAVLDNTSLLSVQGIEIGMVADAKSTVASSVAKVTGKIGSVKVGSLALPALSGLDLTSAADVLNAAGSTVTGAVGNALGVLNAKLANMIKVDVLKITELVAADGAYTSATASVTALTATITPPALLAGAVNVTGSASDVLGQVSTAVPALAPLMGQLEASLGVVDLLTSPTTVTVGRLSSQSAFRPVLAAGGELPRTGTNTALPAMAAILVAGVALGFRRFLNAIAS